MWSRSDDGDGVSFDIGLELRSKGPFGDQIDGTAGQVSEVELHAEKCFGRGHAIETYQHIDIAVVRGAVAPNSASRTTPKRAANTGL